MQKEFTILLRRRVPFLTQASFLLICVCSVIFWLLYYIRIVPEWFKYLSSLAILGFVILTPLYIIRRRTPSSLLILNDRLIIRNKSVNVTIPFVKIKRVFVNDLTNYKNELKHKIQIAISYKREKTVAFLLANYEDIDELVQSLSVLDPDKFSFYNDKISAERDAV